jgi:cytochrome c553
MRNVFGFVAVAALMVGCGNPPQTTVVSPPAPAHTPRPHSTLAQLMRGIPFTFANIVFDAQSQDPGARKGPAQIGGGATETYKSVYGGWQEVENSALALAETSNLIMIPGRLCENGRPVPVEDEKFRNAAEGLVKAGQAAYEAAKSKDMDKIVEVSDTVAAACAACHEPYRDFDDQKDRCQSAKASTE